MMWITDLTDSFMRDITSTEVNALNGTFRLLLSMLLGMVVGAERKHKGQIAGIRTFTLISLGACLAMLLSIYVPQVYLGLKNGDPGRIAAQVITGIGFIGGGAMIHLRGSVRGLTTAAGIWITAIVGMAVGVGMYIGAFAATALCLVVLVLFDRYEKGSRLGQEARVINITTEAIIDDIEPYRRVLADNEFHLTKYFIECDYATSRCAISLFVLGPCRDSYLKIFDSLREIAPTQTIALSSQTDI